MENQNTENQNTNEAMKQLMEKLRARAALSKPVPSVPAENTALKSERAKAFIENLRKRAMEARAVNEAAAPEVVEE